MTEAGGSPASDEVKPYKIHIPTKHLDLTRQKLELSRTPHRPLACGPRLPPAQFPTSLVPRLICPSPQARILLLARHRVQQPEHNSPVPHRSYPAGQPDARPHPLRSCPLRGRRCHRPPPADFPPSRCPPSRSRTSFPPSPSPPPTSAEYGDEDAGGHQQQRKRLFRVVIPSIPGTASSDPLPPQLFSASTASTTPAADNKADPVAAVAALFDALMRRLGYERYLVGATAPSSASITAREGRRRGRIDERIVRRLARRYGHEHGVSSSSSLSSCVGAHIVSPVLRAPRFWAEGGGGTGPGGSLRGR
ncbi:uncharacterized protein P884DRAFT_33461 [Thermothelomyces heterothallicus CBS 202.75]|uniref:uncharacterized protein n=1 Tax=Thermothelomyces heterothallicus CBS 202.75 TaxID=1149848 RepID=UPI0037446F7E